ncbi:MAG: hypothetical protein OEV49_12420 [candidate division Zixibacteria bacterium]|nr:hypothetical protein [candidate division Zixibacteria bacterium]MDH3935919.1 hypothetical protein [candidate division Zixibacteria bacterium]MDH4034340.1 hypothetical protein [candidate division Zixibacteria bacterium]
MADESHDDRTQTHIVLTKGAMESHYRIVEKNGADVMGEVYLAYDTELHRRLALKFFITSEHIRKTKGGKSDVNQNDRRGRCRRPD